MEFNDFLMNFDFYWLWFIYDRHTQAIYIFGRSVIGRKRLDLPQQSVRSDQCYEIMSEMIINFHKVRN